MSIAVGGLLQAAAAVDSAPAAGAELRQVLIGGFVSTAWIGFVVLLGLRHRAGKSKLLSRISRPLARIGNLPGWVALPFAVGLIAFITSGPGFVWDVALHVDRGRDAGPFANPSHYLLIFGTLLFVTAGWLAIVMPRSYVGPSGVRIAGDWVAPAGGVAMLACGTMSLSGFVLDDVWHRLFGQDVTLWGPTHLMMITGGLMVLVSSFVLIREGRLSMRPSGVSNGTAPHVPSRGRALTDKTVTLILAGVVPVGLTIAYQQEFGYGMPQFLLLFQPVLIALTAGISLVGARIVLGVGGALGATAVYLVVSGTLTLLVGPVLGESTLHFPLYVVEALLVEAAAWRFLKQGPYRFAAASGVLIGTIGVFAEFGWSHAWMPLPWPAEILPEAVGLSVIAATAGGVIGQFFATTLKAEPGTIAAGRRAWMPAAASLTVAAVTLGLLLPTTAPRATASVELTDVTTGGQRTANATVKFDPPEIAEDPYWLEEFAWQGKQKVFGAPLRRVEKGVWKTTKPMPVHGTWKTAIRLHRGRAMLSVPVYMPADTALSLAAVPASASFTRPMLADKKLMQRERRDDVPTWMFATGSAIVAALTGMLILMVGWALLRVARGDRAAVLERATSHNKPATSARISAS